MRWITTGLLLVITPNVYSDYPIVTYGPSRVGLNGKLDLQTFPGPPNYEDIHAGDEIETHFYLKLNAPVDVLPKGDHPGVQDVAVERNVRIVQLSIPERDELWSKIRRKGNGATVRVTGTLFHRFTGHHHSRVLLLVENIEYH